MKKLGLQIFKKPRIKIGKTKEKVGITRHIYDDVRHILLDKRTASLNTFLMGFLKLLCDRLTFVASFNFAAFSILRTQKLRQNVRRFDNHGRISSGVVTFVSTAF